MSNTDERPNYQADFTGFQLSCNIHEDGNGSRRGHTGLHINYESGEWHYAGFFAWLKNHILSYALTTKEIIDVTADNAPLKTALAARLIHNREKNIENRGEIGELILHGLIRDVYKTSPLISKIYYKSDTTDTVKGFDAVHVLYNSERDEISSLWLGEAKFYTDAKAAIRSAFESVNGFLNDRKMKREFIIIKNHLDDSHQASKRAEELLAESTSLDEIRPNICVPVLIAYVSDVTKKHNKVTTTFIEEIKAEVQANIDNFAEKFKEIEDVHIHVFFMPLKDKDKVEQLFNETISGLQGPEELY